MKTLIVDDHEMFRMGMVALLGQMDQEYDIIEAGDLAAANEAVANHEFDLLLIDFNLPDGNGLQFIQGFKTKNFSCDVIMMSGTESQELAAEAMLAGANGFLPKSYAGSEVKSALNKIMAGEFFIPDKLKNAPKDRASMAGSTLLSVGSNVLDSALDPVIIFENSEKHKLEYVNQAAEQGLGINRELVGQVFSVEDYITHQPLLDFLKDPARESFMINAIRTSNFKKEDQWLSVSCSKIEFLGSPSVMFYLKDITDLKNREADLEKASNTDPMTELLNRRGFYLKANDEFDRAKRFNQPLSIVTCDLDHFKRLNDTFGHDFGDAVLKAFSLACRNTFRKQDLPARFGGEEFVIGVVNADQHEAETIAERLRKLWEASGHEIEGQECQSTVSIGVAQLKPEDEDIDAVIKRADQHLYYAKENGRNQVCGGVNPD